MAKVDWISWKTETDEIINPEKIFEKMSTTYSEFKNNIDKEVKNKLLDEIANGGLNENALFLNGSAPAYESTMKIINSIEEMQAEMSRLINSVRDDTLNQKEIEKKQLIEAIENKIQEEEKILENTTSLKNRLNNNHSGITIDEVSEIENNIIDRINKLKERLENAKSL